MLELRDVTYRYPGAPHDALAGVSLSVGPREFHAVLGPNGSGKTTLVRIALGTLKPDVGRADLIGRSAFTWPRQELARLVGVVPQREDNLFPQRVRETVLLGRYRHLSLGGDAVGRRISARPRRARARAGAQAARARRPRHVARHPARDGAVRADPQSRGRAGTRRPDDHARPEPRRALRRLRAVAQRGPSGGRRRAERRAHPVGRRVRVFLARRDADRRWPAADDPAPPTEGDSRMKAVLIVLALAQQPKDTVVLKPVVVTATRTPATADVLPAAVTVLKGADLTAKGIRTVAQALEAVPGLHIAATGSIGGQTAIFTRGGESDYTKVLLDGVPLNQAGGGIDLAHLTTDNVDHIEIVRGPVSVLYGSDAVTGVVQVFTKAGAGSRESGAGRLGAEFRGGTYGSAEEALDFAGGTPRVSYSASASRFSSDGLYSYNNQYRNSVATTRGQTSAS